MPWLKPKIRAEGGFSLAELLIVIAIIGILAGIVIMNLTGSEKSAKEAKLRANLVVLREALLAYKADHGFFPCAPGDYNTSGNENTFKRQLLWYTNKAGKPSRKRTTEYRFGPYLQDFPEEPITGSKKVYINRKDERLLEDLKKFVSNSRSANGGWYYEARSGNLVAYLGKHKFPEEYAYY